jgi:peptide methionine sulfoxide reductase MsrB
MPDADSPRQTEVATPTVVHIYCMNCNRYVGAVFTSEPVAPRRCKACITANPRDYWSHDWPAGVKDKREHDR